MIEVLLEEAEEELLVAPFGHTALNLAPEDQVEPGAHGLGELEVERRRPLNVGASRHYRFPNIRRIVSGLAPYISTNLAALITSRGMGAGKTSSAKG